MLKQPENIVLNDFKQHRAAALDAQLIGQYEELVTDWINTIETMLNDTSDERYPGPLFYLQTISYQLLQSFTTLLHNTCTFWHSFIPLIIPLSEIWN